MYYLTSVRDEGDGFARQAWVYSSELCWFWSICNIDNILLNAKFSPLVKKTTVYKISYIKTEIMFCCTVWLAKYTIEIVGLGGLGVTCSPRNQRFAGSNPAEVDGFFQDVRILSTSPPGGTLSWGSRVWDFRLVKESQAWKNRPLNKSNRHIHVLVIPKFGEAQ